VVVDRYGASVRIAAVCGQLFDLAVLPNHRLVLQHLILTLRGITRWAGGIISVAPDGSPIFTRDIGTQEVYALSVKRH
jgi:hypothetical protein